MGNVISSWQQLSSARPTNEKSSERSIIPLHFSRNSEQKTQKKSQGGQKFSYRDTGMGNLIDGCETSLFIRWHFLSRQTVFFCINQHSSRLVHQEFLFLSVGHQSMQRRRPRGTALPERKFWCRFCRTMKLQKGEDPLTQFRCATARA